jgi:hypothetical protein
MGNPLPPLEYLFECSVVSLQDLEMAALNRSANCLKRAKIEWDEAVAQREVAGVARWFIENRAHILKQARNTVDTQVVLVFPERKRA